MGFEEIIEQEMVNKQGSLKAEDTIQQNPVVLDDNAKSYDNVPDLSQIMVSLEDINMAMFNEFDKKNIVYDSKGQKVPVVWAGSSRWSVARRTLLNNPQTAKLRLPIISVISKGSDIDRKRWYPTSKGHETDFKVGSLIKGDNNYIKDIFISPPTPVVCSYEIAVWTSSNIEMDRYIFKQITDILSDFCINIRNFRFQGYLESISDENNFTDYGTSEIVIRKRYSIKVDGYLINEKNISLINRLIQYHSQLIFKPDEELTNNISDIDKKYDY